MANLCLTRTVHGFIGTDDAAREIMRRIKIGRTVKAEIAQPRNLKHHRKFFALLQVIWQATGEWASVDDLLIELKLKLGLTQDVIIRESGEVVKILGSISFAKMDQSVFDKFYDGALKALCEMAGGIESNMVRDEVLRQIGAA